jgi:hypothetical protein
MPVLEQKTGPLYPEILAIMRRYNLNVASAFQFSHAGPPAYIGVKMYY